ncbi:MAG: hydrogenase maturation protease [Anaerolineales bacterium]|nr:hydrogenase maturation protease [Anaerolineales bacterium]
MRTSRKTLILALGNPLREDDGISTAVLSMLKERLPTAADVDLLDGGTAGLDCALLWEGYENLILIDAADMGLPPGQWRRFGLEDMQLDENSLRSIGAVHAAGLNEALVLGRALGNLPPRVIVFGIQPETIQYGMRISSRLLQALPELCEAVLHTLDLQLSIDT